jgi:hypothetical protein
MHVIMHMMELCTNIFGMIKFVIQITLKWKINMRTNYINVCFKLFNNLLFVIYHLPNYV